MEKFAFIIHPLSLKNVENFEKGAVGRPKELVEKILEWTPPFKISNITGIKSKTGKEVEGFFVACPLMPAQFKTLSQDFVVNKVVKSCELAEKLEAKIIGLGAFTAMVGNGGKDIAEKINTAVTTGNTYTTTTAIQATKKAVELMEIELNKATLAVIGATGSIGSACAQVMAPEVGRLELVGRNESELKTISSKIEKQTSFKPVVSTDISKSVVSADVIITVTGAIDCVINPEDIKSGAVVCDVARPRDVSKLVGELRNDVLVIDGGIVRVPGEKVNFNYNFGPPPGMSEGCVAETIILALEERFEDYTLGKDITIEMVEEMAQLAEKHGFEVAALRRYETAISDEQIEEIKKNVVCHKTV
ncbi:MAG: shikimate dehydrogenase [Actinobacteria bacterium]|nr:shikimate dehydrogenase [Actinomycetota bacterium]